MSYKEVELKDYEYILSIAENDKERVLYLWIKNKKLIKSKVPDSRYGGNPMYDINVRHV